MRLCTDKFWSRYDLANVKGSPNQTQFRINWFQIKRSLGKTRHILNHNIDSLAIVVFVLGGVFNTLNFTVGANISRLYKTRSS